MDKNLKIAIFYYYIFALRMVEPSPKVYRDVMDAFRLVDVKGSRNNLYNKVKRTIAAIIKCENNGLIYSNEMDRTKRGRKQLIQEFGVEANIIYDAKETSLSNAQCASLLNAYHAKLDPPMPKISCSAVTHFVATSEVMIQEHRQTKKSGKEDAGTAWAKARVEQCLQFKKQLELPVEELRTAHPGWPKVQLDALVIWDEHHRKIILGHTSKMETRVCRNETRDPCTQANGGKYPPRMPRTSVKYPGEARGCFGVAVRTNPDGSKEGVKCKPFNYTNRTVCSISEYKEQLENERKRVLPLKGPWGKPDEGYPEKYGREQSSIEIMKTVNKKYCSISELMDHVIAESKTVYEGTAQENTFLIYHDALSIWWSAQAQKYISGEEFLDRQLKCMAPTNTGTRYAKKLVGDSPELCRGLDSHGFADLKRSTLFHSALTSSYAIDDVRRFKMGTPAEVWSTIERCWTVEPTSERIVEDIYHLPIVLDKIIEAGGCVVQDEFLRTGRRHRRADDKGDCKIKPRRSSRKETAALPPIHSDAAAALGLLSRSEELRQLQFIANAENHQNDHHIIDSDAADDNGSDGDDSDDEIASERDTGDSSDSDTSESTVQPEEFTEIAEDDEIGDGSSAAFVPILP